MNNLLNFETHLIQSLSKIISIACYHCTAHEKFVFVLQLFSNYLPIVPGA